MTGRTQSSPVSTLDERTSPAEIGLRSSMDPHELECRIQRDLQSRPGLNFVRLTVHQCPQGICLEGLLETEEVAVDLCDLVNEIAGVKAINRVVVRTAKPK